MSLNYIFHIKKAHLLFVVCIHKLPFLFSIVELFCESKQTRKYVCMHVCNMQLFFHSLCNNLICFQLPSNPPTFHTLNPRYYLPFASIFCSYMYKNLYLYVYVLQLWLQPEDRKLILHFLQNFSPRYCRLALDFLLCKMFTVVLGYLIL